MKISVTIIIQNIIIAVKTIRGLLVHVRLPLVCCVVFGYDLSTSGAVKPNPDERALTSNDLLRNT